MYPVDFPDRLEDARSRKSGRVNCISAAHFLLGLIDHESYIPPDANSFIKRRFQVVETAKGLNTPIPDEAIAFSVWSNWEKGFWHMGVFSPYDRNLIIHRESPGKPISETTMPDIEHFYFPYGYHQAVIQYLKISPQWYLNRIQK